LFIPQCMETKQSHAHAHSICREFRYSDKEDNEKKTGWERETKEEEEEKKENYRRRTILISAERGKGKETKWKENEQSTCLA